MPQRAPGLLAICAIYRKGMSFYLHCLRGEGSKFFRLVSCCFPYFELASTTALARPRGVRERIIFVRDDLPPSLAQPGLLSPSGKTWFGSGITKPLPVQRHVFFAVRIARRDDIRENRMFIIFREVSAVCARMEYVIRLAP